VVTVTAVTIDIGKEETMKFYDREDEMSALRAIKTRSEKSAQMTFVMGRRRVGKTSLLNRVFDGNDTLYFFVAKKNEALLCAEFIETVKEKLGVPILGTVKEFKALFAFLMDISAERRFTLIIDEFQEFLSINPGIYSQMQHIWDAKKETSKLNLILCGSIYTLMKKIFEDIREPLFGRATGRLDIKALPIASLKEIMSDYAPEHNADDLLSFYMLTGGIPKYVELLAERGAFSLDTMLDAVFSKDSLFLDEGKTVMIDEFGKEYGVYFSILTLIALSKTSRTEIESILEIETGGYLNRLEHDFNIIERVRPILAKPQSRSVKYRCKDLFLSFWFRYIYNHRGAIEMGNFDYVKTIIRKDYPTYSGVVLERYFTEKLAAEMSLSALGAYWEHGNKNEIDIVALNEYEKKALIIEVKRRKKNIRLDALRNKSVSLVQKLSGYEVTYNGLSLEDM
jgi:AAA+ ATPase superfamily predicted ATPase